MLYTVYTVLVCSNLIPEIVVFLCSQVKMAYLLLYVSIKLQWDMVVLCCRSAQYVRKKRENMS